MPVRILALLIFLVTVPANGAETHALFQVEMNLLKIRPLEENIKAFEQLLRTDRDFAPTHHQLAKLYMAHKNPTARQKAERAIKQAIALDPQNTDYQITHSELLWEQSHWTQSMTLCEEILSNHPNNAPALSRIGYHAVQNHLKYRDMRDGPATWRQEAKKNYEKAVEYLKKSIAANPKLRDPYYHLGLLYYENERKDELVQIARQLLKHHPNDKDGLLFCGLGYQMQDAHNKAYEFYNLALEQMTGEERALMEDVELIAEKHEKDAIKITPTDSTWTDTQAHTRFWQKRDPLLLTPYNEHRMTHYGRIAYANLRFSRPSNGVAGWETDPGKTITKFGRPLRRLASRPDIDVIMDVFGLEPYSPPLYKHIETWVYEGFKIELTNRDGLDNLTFTVERTSHPMFGIESLDINADNRPLAFNTNGQPIAYVTSREVFNKTEHRYTDPYQDQKYLIPHQLVTFKDTNGLRLELAYALPKERVISQKSNSPLIAGVFLFNEQWDLIYQKKRLVKDKPNSYLQLEHPDHPDNYLLFTNTLQIPPSTYNIVIESLNKDPQTVGVVRTMRKFAYPDTTLTLSDLLIARSIKPTNAFPEKRTDLQIILNPQHTFNFIEPVFVYLETYNLTQDKFGQTQYDITYRVTNPKQKKIDPALFKAVDLPATEGQTEITTIDPDDDFTNENTTESIRYHVRYITPKRNLFNNTPSTDYTTTAITNRYQGTSRDDFTYLQIDIERVPVGIHQLDVTLFDRHSKQTQTKSVLFRIVN